MRQGKAAASQGRAAVTVAALAVLLPQTQNNNYNII
jgi:hypothetical protein